MRICGGCTACCTVLDVPDAEAPPGCDCSFMIEGGCGIYPTRPNICRDWQCQWMADNDHKPPLLRDDEKPDVIGIMFNIDIVEGWGALLVAHELRPGAVDEQVELLERLATSTTVMVRRCE